MERATETAARACREKLADISFALSVIISLFLTKLFDPFGILLAGLGGWFAPRLMWVFGVGPAAALIVEAGLRATQFGRPLNPASIVLGAIAYSGWAFWAWQIRKRKGAT